MTIDYSIQDIYGDLSMSDAEFDAIVDRSLHPRGAEMLYDKMAALGLDAHHHLLDLGCRDAAHTCRLVARFGCTALGGGPVARSSAASATEDRRGGSR